MPVHPAPVDTEAGPGNLTNARPDHNRLTDSVFSIQGVEVKAERIFLPEEAGMKTSVIDTQVLRHKMSLSLSELLSENTQVFI
jgi:hypothetical protein